MLNEIPWRSPDLQQIFRCMMITMVASMAQLPTSLVIHTAMHLRFTTLLNHELLFNQSLFLMPVETNCIQYLFDGSVQNVRMSLMNVCSSLQRLLCLQHSCQWRSKSSTTQPSSRMQICRISIHPRFTFKIKTLLGVVRFEKVN